MGTGAGGPRAGRAGARGETWGASGTPRVEVASGRGGQRAGGAAGSAESEEARDGPRSEPGSGSSTLYLLEKEPSSLRAQCPGPRGAPPRLQGAGPLSPGAPASTRALCPVGLATGRRWPGFGGTGGRQALLPERWWVSVHPKPDRL
ncbi:hypothetical protein J1605_011856 [Eschrichtius robustus]|uniref:Uncharacterized protein n=1 Tax=Eschrichtius robustus TaxID=9764 RepID=A0AB34GLU3_ESCRO|nr:hypothetical protein J1605_011856 [Eschrichtius robustus]